MTPKDPETPASPAHLVWIWVLAAPQTKVSDALLAVEMEGRGSRRILPVFETKDQALALRKRLCPDQPERYGAQAMLLNEAVRFAAEHQLEILLLDAAGTILARLDEPGP